MSELPARAIDAPPDPSLSQRAERIRNLVGAQRVCVIEAGRELIAASDECPRGHWGEWLRCEFGWAESTARNYINVAIAFQSATVGAHSSIEIDTRALYLLAAPSTPAPVREAAIARAEAGDHHATFPE